MIVPAGNRDTLVTFQERMGAQDAGTGAWSYTWGDVVPDEWAEVREVLPSRGENLAQGIDISQRPCRIRTIYRADITPDMRVVIAGLTFEIVSGPVALGSPARPEGLEMMCVAYSTPEGSP
jgi:head-tail adaptor